MTLQHGCVSPFALLLPVFAAIFLVMAEGMRLRLNKTFAAALALVAGAVLATPVAAQDGASNETTLTVHVENVAPEGMIRLGLYTEAAYPDNDSTPVASADVRATAGETVVTLRNVPVGIYAIEVYQDLNSNGKMDSGFLGLPKEPYGFSRDARPRLSKPDFDRVKFTVEPGQNSQSLHLQNLTAPREVASD
jgi:uncharacterized protein (DUF2141 family)